MAKKTGLAYPAVGEWFNRKNGERNKPRKDYKPVDQITIVTVDGKKEDITIARLDGFDPSGAPMFGRTTTVSFKSWLKSGRSKYTKIDPPQPQPQPQTSHAEPAAEASADDVKLGSLAGMLAQQVERLTQQVDLLTQQVGMMRRLPSIAENGPLFAAKAS